MSDLKGQPVVKAPSRNTADSDATKLLRVTRDGMLLADYLLNLSLQGRIFAASDADEDDTITGAGTVFVATTPTLLLDVPSGTTCMPLAVNLRQAGTVATGTGGISVAVSVDTGAVRYSSGGTSETRIRSTRTDTTVANRCTLYSAPTAAAASNAVALYHDRFAFDVDPVTADAGRFEFDWAPKAPIFIVGPGSFLIFTYTAAASTGPTWRWSIQWGEIPSSDLS